MLASISQEEVQLRQHKGFSAMPDPAMRHTADRVRSREIISSEAVSVMLDQKGDSVRYRQERGTGRSTAPVVPEQRPALVVTVCNGILGLTCQL